MTGTAPAPAPVPERKPFFQSKTLWINLAAVLAAAFAPAGAFGHVLAPEEVALGLGIGNLILRFFTTKGLVT